MRYRALARPTSACATKPSAKSCNQASIKVRNHRGLGCPSCSVAARNSLSKPGIKMAGRSSCQNTNGALRSNLAGSPATPPASTASCRSFRSFVSTSHEGNTADALVFSRLASLPHSECTRGGATRLNAAVHVSSSRRALSVSLKAHRRLAADRCWRSTQPARSTCGKRARTAYLCDDSG